MRFRSIITLMFLLLFLGSSVVQAQDGEGKTREERLREHEERVRKIIEQRRIERENNEGNEVPTIPPQLQPVDEPEVTPQLSSSFGSVILYNVFRVEEPQKILTVDSDYKIESQETNEDLFSLDTVVRQGDRFVSEVRMQNSGGAEFDRIRIALKYDKRFIQPIRVFDDSVRGAAIGKPKFDRIERDSILVYDIEFETPRVSPEVVVLKIVWEAKLTTEFTSLNFAFANAETEDAPHTGVYMNGENVLGAKDDPIDGVLSGSLLVLEPFDPNRTDKLDISQGKKEELRQQYLENVGSQSAAGLKLVGPETTPAVGQDFNVDVHLENPGGAVIDSLRFFIVFDPEVLQVVDSDRGNWIRRGVNVHDGPYRLQYPFEYHQYNEADNRRGRIRYAMGIGRTISLPTGTLASVTFKAMKPIDQTAIELVASRSGTRDLTAIQILGYQIMSYDPKLTTPKVDVSILEQPLEGDLEPIEAVQVDPESMKSVPDFFSDHELAKFLSGTPR